MIQLVELYEIISQVCNFDWYIDVQKLVHIGSPISKKAKWNYLFLLLIKIGSKIQQQY